MRPALVALLGLVPGGIGAALAQEAPVVAHGCLDDLGRTGAVIRPWPVRGSAGCEVPQGVMLVRGGAGLRFGKGARVNCGFATRLLRFEAVLGAEARRVFGRKVARIEHLGTYSCRHMAAYPDLVSEHSFANAIDIAAFVLDDGHRIAVESDWVPAGKPARRPEAVFLRALARRLFDEQVFSVVLTPSYDRHHHNHFHLDGATYRVDGT